MTPVMALVLAVLAPQANYEAEALRALPVPGVRLIETETRTLTLPTGATIVPTDRPFGDVVRMVVAAGSARPYDLQVFATPSVAAVGEGDTVYATFWARRTDSDQPGVVSVHLQESTEPWTQVATTSLQLGPDWRRYHVSGVSRGKHPVGGLNLAFHLARQRQTIELGGLLARNLGPNVDPNSIPFNALRYAGEEPNAAWRAEAAERIRRTRMANLDVRVLDAQGKPVRNANVRVALRRHAFEFGSFVEEPLLETGPDGDRYRATFDRLFNKATVPMYWADWGWEYEGSRKRYLAFADYFWRKRVPTKAHVLIYPGWNFLPGSLRALETNPAELRRRIDGHVDEILAATKKYGFVSWDVINETRDLQVLPPLLGPEFYADLFRAAHAAQPKATLYINEYAILSDGGTNVANHDHYEGMIRDLLARKAPLGGIGMQGHFGESLTPPTQVWKVLDRFAKFGLPIQVTEFDIATRDEAGQAAYTRDFLTALFAHPSVTGFTVWGFWEKSMWTKNGAMFRPDWRPKPNASAFESLTRKTWWTDATAKSDRGGKCRVRGFKGTYEVTVRAGGAVVRRTVDLDRDRALDVRLAARETASAKKGTRTKAKV
ncbi:MAG: endo-1,4-beta-xylanase [Fimbriimonadaceae bacterium]|nr:endo-1,4-beta-xylanase [Fimbriimonadaceae bacterium]